LPSGNTNAPFIERRYLSQADACTEAIKTLLKKRGRLLDESGPDDGTEVKEDSANEHRST